MSEANPYIDYGNLPAPSDGILATLFLTVRNIAVSLDFYSRVLGGTVVLEENPRMVRLSNSWIIMNPGGGPTPDTPGIAVVNYEPNDTMSIFLNLRVADVEACDGEWSEKRATFVTPPIDRGSEIRCYMPDPDGHLIELGQASGLLRGALAKKRLAAAPCITVTDEDAEERTHRFGPMPPHPEVPNALRRQRDHCFRLFALADNTLEFSGRQLENGGVIDLFERRFSVDESVNGHKPAHLFVASELGSPPRDICLGSMPRLGHHRGSCRRLTGRSDLACRQRLARRRDPSGPTSARTSRTSQTDVATRYVPGLNVAALGREKEETDSENEDRST